MQTINIVVTKTSHWWKAGEEYIVYSDPSWWPAESRNERGLTFDGTATHYRLIDKEKFILKSEAAIVLKVIPVRATVASWWYADRLNKEYLVYADPKDWPEDIQTGNPDLEYLCVDNSGYILKADCKYDNSYQNVDVKLKPASILNTKPGYSESINDPVNKPAHYTFGKIEVIEAIEDWQLNFKRGQVIKYVARAGKKDPTKELEDLKKAQWYLNREIEQLKNGNSQS